MDKETYFQKVRAEYQEFILDKVKVNPEHFGDLETRSAYLMGMHLSFHPWEFKEGFYEAVQDKDWQSVNNYLYQEMRYWFIPSGDSFSGCDHSIYFFHALEAFACGADQVFESVYPYDLGPTQNGYKFCVVGSNLVFAKYYRDEELLEQAVAAAVKFTGGRASKWERLAIQFLLDVLNKDLEVASENLLGICKGYSRINLFPMMSIEDICIPAHGLYCIAKRWLSDEEFAKIVMPKHKAFLQDYAKWRIENLTPILKPYMVYPEDMDILNRIYAAPVVKTMLKMERETELSKLRPGVDEYQMHQVFVVNLKNQNTEINI